MVFTFLTFRSMEGVTLFERAYARHDNAFNRALTRMCGCCCSKRKEQLESLYIGGCWPRPKTAILPDNIFWENLSVGPKQRAIRRGISFVIGFVILVASILGILSMEWANKELQGKFYEPESCSEPDKLSKEDAVNDYLGKEGLGLLHCFCYQKIVTEQNREALDITFKDIAPYYSEKKWCEEWAINYGSRVLVKNGKSFSAVIINIIATIIFELLGKFQSFYTKNE